MQDEKGPRELQQSSSTAERMDFSMEDVRRLPPCLLYSSKADLTVPW